MDIKGVNYLKCDRKNCFYNVDNECQCVQVRLTEGGFCDRIEAPQRKRYKIKGYKKNPKNIYTVKVQWDEEEIEEAIKKIMRGNRSNLQILDDAADFRKPKHIEDNIYYMSGGTE